MKSVKQIDVRSKKVFVRVDYNVPFDEDQNITDDNRIVATLDLIAYLQEQNAKIILASHLGRPNGEKNPKLSLKPVCEKLSKIISQDVWFIDDCIGDSVLKKVRQMEDGQILMLENLRFYNEEKSNDKTFSKQLAALCDVYINNAFAVSHRNQASVTGIPKYAPQKGAGFLLEKELQSYYDSVENPKKPLVAIIGGAKVSSKLAALENMLNFVDTLIIGGAMANTFLKAQGIDTKGSIIEKDLLQTAAGILEKAKEKGVNLLLPKDLVCAQKFNKNALSRDVLVDQIPDKWMALDIGPITCDDYAKVIKDAGTIVWNGPMGVFEMTKFRFGTQSVANAIATSSAFSIVGGGDTGLAVKICRVVDQISYISTGGGAFLHLMEGKKLPGAIALE
ncbi:MAG: phosphoglycerate kinase [Desulfobacula sp.]|nr:phosphoglycerate kinase [Desulfobacula sp.]